VWQALAVGALDGIRVLDLGVLIQVPQAAATLREWGADVIKVEFPLIGDSSRLLPIDLDDPRSPFHAAYNRGKRSITLDFHVPEAREIFLRLADRADVVLANFAPGRMEAWGLGYDDLSARNPRIVYAVGSAYGEAGPDAAREGVDINVQAAGGVVSTIGVDDGDLSPVGYSVVDHIASQNLLAGILAALYVRERTGRGQRIAGSLLGAAIWSAATEYTSLAMSGHAPGRANGGHPLVYGILGVFPTADGGIAVAVAPNVRDVFYAVIGRPELEEQYPQLRYSNDEKKGLFPMIADALATKPTSAWCEVFDAAGVRCTPVRGQAEVMADPGAWANGYFTEVDGADGPVTVVAAPVHFSETPACPPSTAPELGEHTEEILLELGYDAESVAHLREIGAV
jgi:crotonobetainyl-CoA:carnitine CoA-transferase CaiB-like acyl-CoA transferase